MTPPLNAVAPPPPKRSIASTSAPSRLAWSAAAAPAPPKPTTTTSASSDQSTASAFSTTSGAGGASIAGDALLISKFRSRLVEGQRDGPERTRFDDVSHRLRRLLEREAPIEQRLDLA